MSCSVGIDRTRSQVSCPTSAGSSAVFSHAFKLIQMMVKTTEQEDLLKGRTGSLILKWECKLTLSKDHHPRARFIKSIQPMVSQKSNAEEESEVIFDIKIKIFYYNLNLIQS